MGAGCHKMCNDAQARGCGGWGRAALQDQHSPFSEHAHTCTHTCRLPCTRTGAHTCTGLAALLRLLPPACPFVMQLLCPRRCPHSVNLGASVNCSLTSIPSQRQAELIRRKEDKSPTKLPGLPSGTTTQPRPTTQKPVCTGKIQSGA